MKWKSVRLIYLRELRDQLRDRRTLFTIAVLPLLLYPLLGMSFIQVTQFRREHNSKIWLLGADALPKEPALLSDEGGAFATSFCTPEEAQVIALHVAHASPNSDGAPAALKTFAQRQIESGRFDAVVYFPPQFADKLADFRRQIEAGELKAGDPPATIGEKSSTPIAAPPQPTIFVNMASDKSRIAKSRLEMVLARWRQAIVNRNLAARDVPAIATDPFEVTAADVAEPISLRAATWSKILPFVVIVWALTGAFYPAIDLCAGEKERGTLETLLTSPAERSEIVFGKLMTVVTFSMATALLNLASMGLTGAFIITQLERIAPPGALELGPPPLLAVAWLVMALPLISSLFGALSLAVAAFARSSKEGQYYLMPLLLVTLPLMLLSMLPGAELDLGTSLVPVTGMLLLLRTLIEGEYLEAARYAAPVIGVTAICCGLAIRWAVDQFRNESVLFLESERFQLGLWLRHVVRDRGETPRVGDAILCGVLLLMLRFFVGMVSSAPQSWSEFATQTLVVLAALIATPAVLMAIMLTRSPKKTLLLSRSHPLAAPAAALLALLLHPAANCLAQTVRSLYPISDEVNSQLSRVNAFIEQAPSIWALLAVMALAPAICEELAFRGFILSGLRHMGHKWAAIVLSSIFFGAAHGILQQSLTACVVGMVLGFLAVQTGSLLPSICCHLMFNSASIWMGFGLPKQFDSNPVFSWIFERSGDGFTYRWPIIIGGSVLAVAILYWFRRLPHHSSAEESLQSALDHQQPTERKLARPAPPTTFSGKPSGA
jgi:sodium transport system permease protein